MYRAISNTCLTKDGDMLVFGCKNSVIPDGVKYIGPESFENCSGLETIEIPDSVEVISYAAFAGCKNLGSVKLPKALTTIGTESFSYCEKLIKPDIPDSVRIGENAFFIPETDEYEK